MPVEYKNPKTMTLPAAVPEWERRTITYDMIRTGGLTKAVTVLTRPAPGKLMALLVKPSKLFAGSGISSLNLSALTAGTVDIFLLWSTLP